MPQPGMNEQEQQLRILAYASGVLSAHLTVCPRCCEWAAKYRTQQVKPEMAFHQIAGCVFQDGGLVPHVRPLRFGVLVRLVRERL